MSSYKTISSKGNLKILRGSSDTIDSFRAESNKQVHGTEVLTDIYVREPFTKQDYDYFRPNEKTPSDFKSVVKACRQVYQRLNVVKNVIDMMTDFACEGVHIIHPDKKIEAFYRSWAKQVKLSESIEQFARQFLRDGNVVVKRVTAKLTKPVQKQLVNDKIIAKPDVKLSVDNKKYERREIPWRYIFINVLSLNWEQDTIGRMLNQRKLVLELSSKVRKELEVAKDNNQLPNDFKLTKKGYTGTSIPLDMSRIYYAHNKKDDWESWAFPFLQSILSDVKFRDKLRQAEVAALDGVINVIRIWRLGDHKEKIFPDSGAIDKLAEVLQSNVGGGAMDLIWDSLLDMKEYYPPVDQILGNEKYQQVNRDILIGLGVPEVLVGGSGANFSNSWIQLKTLVEKLEAVRTRMKEWIEYETRIVAKTMGFDVPPKVKFKQMSLQDENVTRRLIVSLLDRNVISVEAVLEAYGEDFLTEVERMKYEQKILDKSDIEVRRAIKLDKEEKPDSEYQSPSDKGGRPPDTKDVDRDTRTPQPRTATEHIFYANNLLSEINEHIIPLYLNANDIDNKRQLTNKDRAKIYDLKKSIISNSNLGDSVNPEDMVQRAYKSDRYKKLSKYLNNMYKNFIDKHGNKPNLQQQDNMLVVSWCNLMENKNA